MLNQYLAIFQQKNMAVLLFLGFASGLPFALTSGTLHAWMTLENINIKTIGFFTLVTQAYVFKFLWAPLMDRFVPPFLGRRRGWLVATQLLLALAIFIMGCLNPQTDLLWMALAAVFIAFFSSSQDIVVDAYRTDILPASERGAGAAVSTLGYRIAMLVSGGLALWIATTYLNWQQTYWLMAALILICVVVSFWSNEPQQAETAPKTLEDAVVIPFKDFFSRNNAWIFLLLIVLYKLADVFALSLSTPFLIKGVGLDGKEVAEIHKTLGLFATIIGILLAGTLMQRMTLFRALLIFGILQAISNLGYWLLAITSKNILVVSIVIVFENITGGMATAAFVALLTTLCNRSFSATQYALLSALAAVGRVYVGPFSGWFVDGYGWSTFFLLSIFIAIPSLTLLFLCRHSLEQMSQTNQFTLRSDYDQQYRWAIKLLVIGGISLVLWIILWINTKLDILSSSIFIDWLGNISVLLMSLGIVLGSTLDYLAIRRERNNRSIKSA